MISIPFLSQKGKKTNYYLGLLLKEDNGIVFALELKNNSILVRQTERFNYSNSWDNLVEDIDGIVFKLETELKTEFKDVIFFLYSHLIEEKKSEIKKPYLLKIKQIAKSLDFNPLGYIEVCESLVSYLIDKEQIPISSILIELDKTYFTVLIYKSGKLFHKKIMPKTEDFIADLKSSLAEVKGSFLLPAKIILYDSKDLDDYSTRILSYRWPEDYFIQIPKIEILKEEELIEALIKIFEKQILSDLSQKDKTETLPEENFGFLINKDIKEIEDKGENTLSSFNEKRLFKHQSLAQNIKNLIKNITFFKKINFGNKLWLPVIFLALAAFLVVNEVFFHKADIIVYLPSQWKTKDLTLTLPYKIATFSAEITETKKTSGTNEIGEKAHGEVIIYNTNLNKEKFFSKGTEIETAGLKFVLDTDVKIATAESASTPGQANVKVTAVAIGDEYNITKGKRFNIDDTSYGESANNFVGGAKKKIRTVAKKDMEELEELIIKKAKNMDLFPRKNYSDAIFLSQLTEVNLIKKIFDGEIGEEKETIQIKAKVDNTYFFVSKNDFLNKVIELTKKDFSPPFILDKNSISYQIKNIEKHLSQVKLDIFLKAKLTIKIEKEALLKKIVGKDKSSLEKILKEEINVDGYKLNNENFLPGLNNYLPFIPHNINLKFSNL